MRRTRGEKDVKPKNSDKWAISICGLNCAKCDIYAAAHGNDKARDEIIAWFKQERKQTLNPDDVRCDGCRGSLAVHWSADCKMMLCAQKKGIQYCFECPDFPCLLLREFSSDGVPHHRRTVENLEQMKARGIDAWIDEQKRSGKCVFCP
jgi:hypothetical protein